MKARIQYHIAIAIIVSMPSSYAQMNDYFPLQTGKQQTYSYFRTYSYYNNPPFTLNPIYDYSNDSGSVLYQTLDSTTYQDTITLWTMREIIHINSIEWHVNSAKKLDTTFSTWNQTQDYPIYESKGGNHKLSANMSILKLNGAVYRFPEQGADSIVYTINDNYGTPIQTTFKKGIGITGLYFKYSTVGNWSWNYLKKEVILLSTVTSSKNKVSANPDYFLSQNYPNPFNPSTRINYSLKASSYVELEIFSSLGQSISKLIDGVQSAGNHSVSWDARSIPAGLYYYRLRTPQQTLTKKMVLLK